ncbi:MAG: SAM-dependent methyltransferase [Rheinheimera sp.]|uniref:methyltransferase domain-containing protein n=1 Tax=Arsukibacterium sp. UBA3155 TaxID=1946058 RepID=UPI000C8F1B48|nr:methyltransferase domain-containing protein [Arsukibacterium sp. UBA3155]MAD74597.1 SAM-dependent methyltransferase [Rheinheimera sp.]|tara:strand:- start:27802 stop:28590 length:789 start_codon:yes stop_codon:yes gene_type:complete
MNKSTDRSFDGIAAKFQRNIYQSSKGEIRQQVLLRDLSTLAILQKPCQVLDVGAGQGQLGLALAVRGHQVTLTDISADMLAIAAAAATAQGIAVTGDDAKLRFTQQSLAALSQQAGQQYPLVMCHAMLEWLAEPQLALKQLWQLVEPEGMLSLMYYNKDAKRFSNILYGNFDYVAADFKVKKKVQLSPQNPLEPLQVEQWYQQAGFSLVSKTGVRCFHDYLRDRTQQQSHFQQLLALELLYNQQEPYASLGRYTHLLLHKPR